MPVRRALVGAMLLVTTVATVLVGALGVRSIRQNVVREAQQRVNHNLNTLLVYYEGRLRRLAERVASRAEGVSIDDPDLPRTIEQIRRELDLDVLNLCDMSGRRITGPYPPDAADAAGVPVAQDPVLSRAREGTLAGGTVVLDGWRLRLEGGTGFADAMAVPAADGRAPITTSGLFWWVASPVRDTAGRAAALLYGGQALNFNYRLVDELRDMMFGTDQYEGRPLGTVTIFLGSGRVATNVRAPDGARAIGTVVSDEVRHSVLEKEQTWHARAWVVDAWYLSGYEPLRDPSGRVVGMLYVGLLEAPYDALQTALIRRFLVPVLLVGLLAVLAGLYLATRLVRPIQKLDAAAVELARGNWQQEITVPETCAEISRLAATFREMRHAIVQRDHELRDRNRMLEDTNARLERVNRNYMETLGFVTHELKSPLVTIQTMSAALGRGAVGSLSEEARQFVLRIRRNCEELQDMVRNYLDLSRVERGELEPQRGVVDVRRDVVDPAVAGARALLDSRRIRLAVRCPESLAAYADGDLLRIALTNYLTNVAKYGREGGGAELEVKEEKGNILVAVWNEGAGFRPEERDMLFRKFSRVRNENTRETRGSGLGLFLCKQIVERHGGEVYAESEPGEWARFSFRFPDGRRE